MTAAASIQKKQIAVFVLVLFLFFFRLGDRSFRNPDEGRYAHVSGQMVETGDWLEPKIFGIDYMRKPPLFYWMVAASFKMFGQGEWAARSVPALFGLLGILAAYLFTRKCFGGRAAFFSALLLAVNPWYLHVSRYLVIDSVFSFFVVLSLYFFYLGRSIPKRALFYDLACYTAAALAFLAKGVLAVVIPGASIFVYALLTRQTGRILKESHIALGTAVFFLIVSPWFFWIAAHKPDFWNVFFFREHLSRFTSGSFEHQEGWYFYFTLIFVFTLPWNVVPGPLRFIEDEAKKNKGVNPVLFLLISSIVTVFFLSLSKSKLATYILPAVAPLCVCLGAAWAQWTAGAARRLKIFYVFIAVLTLSAPAVILIMEAVNPEYTSKPFALALKGRLDPEDSVYIYDHPGPFYDFRFYLGRPVTPVGLEGELEICRENPDAKAAVITKNDFRVLLKQKARFYCLMRRSDWGDVPAQARPGLKILKEDKRKIFFQSGPQA